MLDIAAVLNGTGAEAWVVLPDGSIESRSLRLADLQREIAAVHIDSRRIGRCDLFVALPGERAHGREFVQDAFAAGARAALVDALPTGRLASVDHKPGAVGDRYVLVVKNPLVALQDLAKYWRRRHSARIIGITGSIGKTTTKEIVAGVLGRTLRVLKSEANFNSEIGLPLTVMNLASDHDVAVLEMGMYLPGDIADLAHIAEPDIGIVTSIGTNHLERMGSIAAIAREKSRLIAALRPGGLAVLNADDPWTRAMSEVSGIAPTILFGLASSADYRAEDITVHGLDGITFTLIADRERVAIRTHVPGLHTVHAFLAAAAVARSLGMSWTDVQNACELVRLDVRQRIIRSAHNFLIIDDSYNAAPISMNAALALLASSPGTKIAVLGDMLELGPVEEEAHREVGERAAHVADWLVVRGKRSDWLADAAEIHGLRPDRVIRAGSNTEALQAVQTIVGSYDRDHNAWAVLVKGSRGMQLEEVVAGLQACVV